MTHVKHLETQKSNNSPTHNAFVKLILQAKNEITIVLFINGCAFSRCEDMQVKPIPVPSSVQCVSQLKEGGDELASERRKWLERSSA